MPQTKKTDTKEISSIKKNIEAKIKASKEIDSFERTLILKRQKLESNFDIASKQKKLSSLVEESRREEELIRKKFKSNKSVQNELSKLNDRMAEKELQLKVDLYTEESRLARKSFSEAVDAANKLKDTQSINGRKVSAERLEAANREQAEKTRHEAQLLIAELERRKRSTSSAEEQLRIQGQILEIQSESSKVAKEYEDSAKEANEEAKKYAQIIKDATFSRLSGAGKVKVLEDEIASKTTAFQEKSIEYQSEIDYLTQKSKQLESEGDKNGANELAKQAEALKEVLEEQLSEFNAEIAELNSSVDTFTSQAIEEDKQNRLSKVESPQRLLEKMLADKQVADAEKAAQKEAERLYAKTPEGKKEKRSKNLASIAKFMDKLGDKISQEVESFYQYQAQINARLQGSDTTYQSALKLISKNIGISGVMSQKAAIENLRKLSEEGIAYNLELRAFLATVSDKIATTFDVFDSNLLRLIRLQQSDTTAARLGMEASLTRLFNEYFSDTSYLGDNGAFDSVSQALLEANSQLSKNASIEFEYMVQKWLGALYSVGMDSSTIDTIAQGLNYLATGNVNALNGNESLENLLAMSASRAGIPLADILTGGLDAQTTNDLLKSMVEYLQEIAESAENQVVKSAYSDTFGFSIADLTAVQSLDNLNSIHKKSLGYDESMDELKGQLNELKSRIHITEIISNVIENATSNAASGIGNNTATYGLWKILDVVTDATGGKGINIPAIMAAGFGVELNSDVLSLIRIGITGLPLMATLLDSLFSKSLFGTTDIADWGYEEYTSRGSATRGISKGTVSGFSQSTEFNAVGSRSAEDIKNTTLSDAADQADEDETITNKHVDEATTSLNDALISEDTDVITEIIGINQRLDDYLNLQRVFMIGGGGGGSSGDSGEAILPVSPDVSIPESSDFSINSVVEQLVSMNGLLEQYLNEDRIFKTSGSMSSNVSSSNKSFSSNYVSTGGSGAGIYYGSPSLSLNWSQLTDSSAISAFTKLENVISKSDAETILALMAATNVSSSLLNNQINSEHKDVNVAITQMSPEVSSYIAGTVKTMILSALTGGEISEDQTATSFVDKLKSMLSSQELNVKVTNDNFDTLLQKLVFMY